MMRDDDLSPIDNVKRLEDVNQNFDELRKEAKRRQRIYEGIGTPEDYVVDGKPVQKMVGGLKQPNRLLAGLNWDKDSVPLPTYTESMKDQEGLEKELEDFARDWNNFNKASSVDYEGEKDG